MNNLTGRIKGLNTIQMGFPGSACRCRRETLGQEGNGNPLQYSCLENPMDRGGCGLQSMESQRIRYNWITEHRPYKYKFEFWLCQLPLLVFSLSVLASWVCYNGISDWTAYEKNKNDFSYLGGLESEVRVEPSQVANYHFLLVPSSGR